MNVIAINEDHASLAMKIKVISIFFLVLFIPITGIIYYRKIELYEHIEIL